MLGPGFEMRVRYSTYHAREPLVLHAVRLHLIPITTTLLLINYVIISLYIRHHVVNRIENNAVFIFYDVKLRVKQL